MNTDGWYKPSNLIRNPLLWTHLTLLITGIALGLMLK